MTDEVTPAATPKRRGRPPKQPTPVSREPKRHPFKMSHDWSNFDPTSADTPDRFRIPLEDIPEGFKYRWVNINSMGQPQDKNVQSVIESGYQPVCRGDNDGKHDSMCDRVNTGEPLTIEKTTGLYYITEDLWKKYKARDLRAAREQVSVKERAFRSGDLPSVTLDAQHPSAINTNRISKSYEKIEIPKD